ncbi:MAG: GIY-YIG nuclease family protein [Pirellulales bacterium]
MPTPLAKTIQIFLPTGEPRGIRVAELMTRIVQAVLIPRSDLAMAKQREELDHVALYFLFGESESSAMPSVYIGQTEDVRKRLDQHDARKEFWQTAVVIVSRTDNFTQAHIRYLEWYAIEAARKVNRYHVENEQTPSKPHVTEPMEADILDAFETASVLVATLGYPLFEPIVKTSDVELFYCNGRETKGVGQLVEDGFVVHKESYARIEITPSGRQSVESLRRPLLEAGVLVEVDGKLRFTQDYLFKSPSSAAAVLLGRTANGWVEWKNAESRTLDESRRAVESE